MNKGRKINPSRKINILVPGCSLKYSDVIACVYKLIHKETKRIYVGSTSDIYNRLHRHADLLVNRRHHNFLIQSHFNMSPSFTLEYKECSRFDRMNRLLEEQKLLDELFPTGILLNLASNAFAARKGIPLSKEQKEALLKANIGRAKTPWEIKRLSETHLGVKKPPGFREKMRQIALKRPPPSPETREKLRIAVTGRRFSQESIEKMRKAQAKYPIFIDGVKYVSMGDASRKLNLTSGTIRGRVFSKSPNYANYQAGEI